MARRRIEYNKLVRDGVVEKLAEKGLRPQYRVLHPHEVPAKAIKKLVEEAGEVGRLCLSGRPLSAHDPKLLEELADVRQAFLKIQKAFDITDEDLMRAERSKRKRKKVGGYQQDVFLIAADTDR